MPYLTLAWTPWWTSRSGSTASRSSPSTTDRLTAVAEVLDAYATPASRNSFHVVHQANSGGPAGPCNRGLELGDGHATCSSSAPTTTSGPRHSNGSCEPRTHWDSDVIFGRMVGVGGRYVDRRMFGSSRRESASLSSPLAFALSNTKLFRRSLIEENQLRYALELRVGSDQPFTVAALIKSRRTSVLVATTSTYAVRRADGSNISYSNGWRTRLSDIEASSTTWRSWSSRRGTRRAVSPALQREMDKLLRNELPTARRRERGPWPEAWPPSQHGICHRE